MPDSVLPFVGKSRRAPGKSDSWRFHRKGGAWPGPRVKWIWKAERRGEHHEWRNTSRSVVLEVEEDSKKCRLR